MNKQDIEIKWQENINQAKSLFSNKDGYQMDIAKLALEVCEITHGGAKFRDLYTLKRFAEEAGLRPKKLSAWCVVYKRVFEQLSAEQKRDYEKGDFSFTDMVWTIKSLPKSANKEQVQCALQKTIDNRDERLFSGAYLSDMRSCAYGVMNRDLLEIRQDVLEEFLFYADAIRRTIKKKFPKLKPVNHNLAGKYSLQTDSVGSINEVLGKDLNVAGLKLKSKSGGVVTITEKDQKIISFMKKNRRFLGPTEIANHFGFKTKNTAWSIRTLYKLEELGYVEKK